METELINDRLKSYQLKEITELKNIELAKRFIEFLDSSDYDSMKKIFSNDFKLYWGSTNEPLSLEDFIPLHKMFYTAFPDYKHSIEGIFASGNYVVARILLTATHKNDFQGIAPTNKKIAYKSIQIYEIQKDKLKTAHAVEDEMTMMQQLGMELKMKD